MIYGILFYSKTCPFCKTLMLAMKNEGMLERFKLICVNNMSMSELVSSGISKTPTIIIVNEQDGRKLSQQIYEGQEAGKWIENIINNRRMMLIQNVEMQRRNIELQNMKARNADGMVDYFITDNKISDTCSFFHPDIKLELDIAQPKNFVPAYAEERIVTICNDYEDKVKLCPAETKAKMSELENMRNKDTTMLKQSMEKEQIERLMNNRMS